MVGGWCFNFDTGTFALQPHPLFALVATATIPLPPLHIHVAAAAAAAADLLHIQRVHDVREVLDGGMYACTHVEDSGGSSSSSSSSSSNPTGGSCVHIVVAVKDDWGNAAAVAGG